MKTRWIALIVAMALCGAPAHAQNTAGSIAYQDGSNVFSATGNDFLFRGTVATPDTPLASAGATTGGLASSALTYRVYVTYENASGETDLSHTSIEFTPASGSTNLITVTRGAIGANVNTWSAWFTSSADDHRTIRGCGTGGVVVDTAASSATASCICGTTLYPIAPTANSTHDIYPLRVYTGPSTVGASIGSVSLRPDLSGQLLAYVGTAIVARITPNGITPGACPANIWIMETGSRCVDSKGRNIIVNGAGPILSTGGAP